MGRIKLPDYKWRPIEPLSDAERSLDLAAIRPLYEAWRSTKARYKASKQEVLDRFTTRLIRRLSIETGILERLYDLDMGTTEALVTHGFAEELVARTSTNIEPSKLIDLLRDQEAAIQLVMDCIAQNRTLSKSVLHELQAILTRHQETTTAIDQFGNRFEIPLLRGQFKKQPNNPRRPDGAMHEYCPPIHVNSEMENLLTWLAEVEHEDPVIVAAWLHHRFTQIHPYQDGNGRVGRALITLILLRADLLPLVVDRDIRTEYIHALEQADLHDLGPLARQFAKLERSAILQALSVDAEEKEVPQSSLTAAVIGSLEAKFQKRKDEQHAQFRKVNDLARRLRTSSHQIVEQAHNALKIPLSQLGRPDVVVTSGGPDYQNAHWYKADVIRTSEAADKFINFFEDHYFVKGTIRVNTERLVFVVSLHHVGREPTGIVEITAFARIESFEDSEDREFVSQGFFLCSLEPFVITWKTTDDDVSTSYQRWLDAALAIAFKEYGDRL